MPFALRIASRFGRGRRFRFDAEEICIGRSAQSDLFLNDGGVSRTHARIQRRGTGWVLLDCGSANGTELNGAALVSPAQLRNGDRIRVGAVVFRFEPVVQRARASIRLRVAAAGGLLLIAAATAAFVRGPGRTQEAAPEPAVALAWTPPTVADAAATTRVETGPVPVPDAVRAAYERGRRKLDERRIAPRNLFDAWSAFTEARRLLEGVSPEPALRAALTQLIDDAEEDLGRDCNRLLFAAARFQKYGQGDHAQQAYRDLLLRFPGDEPSGCRKIAQARLSAAEESE